MDNRRYVCWWNTDIYDTPETRIVLNGFFTDDNGYTDTDVETVEELNLGETYPIFDMGGLAHTITRVR